MSQQAERLQALLERVQRNRVSHGGGARPPAAAPPMAAQRQAPEPVTGQVAAPARGKGAPTTPLEMALEGRVSRPIDPPTQPISFVPPQPVPRAAPPMQAPAAMPAAKAAPAPVEGRVLVDAEISQPTKPIAQVVSKQPPIAALSFGELLRRSLSLRAR